MRAWLRRRDSGPRLRLSQSLGAFARPDGDVSPLFVFFEVENAGEVRAELREVYVTARNGRPLMAVEPFEDEPRPPLTLSPGASARFRVRAKPLAERSRAAGFVGAPRLKLIVEDGAGNVHEKAFGFRVDEYLKLKDE